MMHLLLEYAAADLDVWRTAFDERFEARGQAGVNLLQSWRQEESGGGVMCLFEVHDRKRAQDWLAVEGALHGAGRATFLRTL